jgi:hypothetical protein
LELSATQGRGEKAALAEVHDGNGLAFPAAADASVAVTPT